VELLVFFCRYFLRLLPLARPVRTLSTMNYFIKVTLFGGFALAANLGCSKADTSETGTPKTPSTASKATTSQKAVTPSTKAPAVKEALLVLKFHHDH